MLERRRRAVPRRGGAAGDAGRGRDAPGATTAPPRAGSRSASCCSRPACRSALDAGGFDRHTFICGQSGSGKTYSLGVVLERLLLETEAADRRARPELRLRAARRAARRRRRRATLRGALRRAAAHAGRTARRRAAARCGCRELDAGGAGGGAAPRPDRATARSTPSSPTLARQRRARPLERLERRSSATARAGCADRPRPQPRRRPLGRLGARGRGRRRCDALAQDATRAAWWSTSARSRRARSRRSSPRRCSARCGAARDERRPVLIVIDEAHNVCPARPEDALTALATEHAVRIAAEGRKFGLYLLVVHPAPAEGARERRLAVRQPRADADELARRPRLRRARSSRSCRRRCSSGRRRSGWARRSWPGLISPHPALLRFGPRIAQEGGGDVPADWSRPDA